MNNEVIFRNAIEKAWEKGYTKGNRITHWHYFNWFETYSTYIFSHEFAKAFWGENLINIDFKQSIIKNGKTQITNIILQDKAWRFHISEMVKCKEPLKYLEKFL